MHQSLLIKSVWLTGAFTFAAIIGLVSTRSNHKVVDDLVVGEKAVVAQSVTATAQQDDIKTEAKKEKPGTIAESLSSPSVPHARFVHDRNMGKQECLACHRTDPKQTLHSTPHLLGVGHGPDLQSEKKIDTAFLGLHASEVPAALRKHLKLKPKQGAIVETVIDESPAYHCGIEVHDVVVAIDSQPVLGEKSLLEKVRSRKPGTKILVEYIRQGQKESCNVVLGKQRTAQILSSFRIKGCPAKLTSSTNCRDCHSSASQ